LATKHPELAKEAHGWDPTTVIAGTGKKLEWKCKFGHTWTAAADSRNRGRGCPICSNQKVLSGFNDLATKHPELAKEAHGWDPTTVTSGTDKKFSWKCISGHTWSTSVNGRTSGRGCPICSNHEVLAGFNDLATKNPELAKEAHGWDPTNVNAGSSKILQWKCKYGHNWSASVANRYHGDRCPICSNKKVLSGFNDLASTHPELAKEAHGWDPTTVTAGTHKKLEWKCKFGHFWETTGHSRVSGLGCPTCSNYKVLPGFNDLASTHPELAKEAHGWDPTTVIAGQRKKLTWKCKEGHTWTARSDHRSNGIGCPSCATSGFDPNQDGYLYFLIHPKWEMFQIGITNFPKVRLNTHSKIGFELLELRGPMDGHSAQELETALLRYLKSQNADLSPEHVAGKFDGYSESWTMDSYKVNNLKELIDKASEAGF
jgi:hypothetical protein